VVCLVFAAVFSGLRGVVANVSLSLLSFLLDDMLRDRGMDLHYLDLLYDDDDDDDDDFVNGWCCCCL